MARLGATVWTGDIHPTWDDLRSTPRALNWIRGGAPYVACDIGALHRPEAAARPRWMRWRVHADDAPHSTHTATPHFPSSAVVEHEGGARDAPWPRARSPTACSVDRGDAPLAASPARSRRRSVWARRRPSARGCSAPSILGRRGGALATTRPRGQTTASRFGNARGARGAAGTCRSHPCVRTARDARGSRSWSTSGRRRRWSRTRRDDGYAGRTVLRTRSSGTTAPRRADVDAARTRRAAGSFTKLIVEHARPRGRRSSASRPSSRSGMAGRWWCRREYFVNVSASREIERSRGEIACVGLSDITRRSEFTAADTRPCPCRPHGASSSARHGCSYARGSATSSMGGFLAIAVSPFSPVGL